jgi:nucleoside-diphosphate-sugar epimerase
MNGESSRNNMNILITGHLGFVGQAYIKHLSSTGHQVEGVDIKSGIDCRDYFKTVDKKFDLVIHLAAIVGGRLTIENDPIAVGTDLSIDSEFFNWVVKTKQPKVIYFSSSAAYPTRLQASHLTHRLKESDIDLAAIESPDLTYGWAKLTGEYLASFARSKDTKIYIFRPFSGYGETQSLDYPFPSFIKRIKDRRDPFEIWGDGTQVRDFIHVDDIVLATLKAVKLDIQSPINLGNGTPVSFIKLAETMFKVSGWTPSNGIKLKSEFPVGVTYRCSDNTHMLSFYQPTISLEEGINRALHYTDCKQ